MHGKRFFAIGCWFFTRGLAILRSVWFHFWGVFGGGRIMKTLVLVCSTNRREAERYVEAVHSAGAMVAFVGIPSHIPEQANFKLSVSQLTVAEAMGALEEWGGESDGVLGVGLLGGVVAAHLAAQLGHAGHTPGGVSITANKAKLLGRLARADIPVPEFNVLEEKDWKQDAIQALNFPIVIQPTVRTRLGPFIRAEKPEESLHFFRALSKLESQVASSGEVLCEEIMGESETLVLAGLTHQGYFHLLAFLDRSGPLEGAEGTGTLFVSPTKQEARLQEQACRYTASACSTLGLDDGPVQALFRIRGEELELIDVAGHPLQGPVARPLSFGRGMGIEEVHVRHALRLEVDMELSREVGATKTGSTQSKGVFLGITGEDRALNLMDIKDVETHWEEGETLVPTSVGGLSPFWVTGQGLKRTELLRTLEEAVQCIQICID